MVLVMALASCGRNQPGPVQWKAPDEVITSVKQARQAVVRAYYLSRVGQDEDPGPVLEQARQTLQLARADTAALTAKERPIYQRALEMFDSYLNSLANTDSSFASVRWTGQAPADPQLEEATTILALLALQHDRIQAFEGALGRKLNDDERRRLKSAYGTVMLGGAGPELGFWPNPEPAEPSQGLIIEVWPEDERTAGYVGICTLKGDSLLPPTDESGTVYYIYGAGSVVRGVVRDDETVDLDAPLADENQLYIGLPGQLLWWNPQAPAPPNPDSCIDAFLAYAQATNQSFDSISVSSSRSFWLWPDRVASIAFVNAFKGRSMHMFTVIVEDGQVSFAKQLDPSQGYLGLELVSTVDLDYDRVSEVVFSLEGEESRSYVVLKKNRGVWWTAVETEARLLGFE